MKHPAPLPAPLYQGSVNTWECDDGGHLNVRFHLERAMSGLAHMAVHLGVPRAFSANAGSTIVPREAHIRFLKEAGADEAVLTMKSLEAFEKAADGKATKIIIPSEIQGLAGLVKSIKEVAVDDTQK